MSVINDEFQGDIYPVIASFILFNIVGFFGNLLVQYIYGLHYPKTRFRCLVLALSLVDLTSCCTTVPLETVSTWYWFDAPSRGLCKAKNFFVQLTGLSAMYLLFVTAVYKYRQICKPLGKQISPKCIIIVCGCGLFGSLICAVPAAVLWDINNHTVTINNVTELSMICEVHSDYHGTLYPVMYRNFLSLYNLFLLATIVLYIFVARRTFIHLRGMKRKSKLQNQNSNTSNSKMSTDADSGNCKNTGLQSDDNTVERPLELETKTRSEGCRTEESSTADVESAMARSTSQIKPIQIRKVLIMVIIAGTFSVTFIMALTFGYVFAVRDYQDYHSLGEIILLFCCYRFYFINYALNPVVYFTLDRTFRREVFKQLRSSR